MKFFSNKIFTKIIHIMLKLHTQKKIWFLTLVLQRKILLLENIMDETIKTNFEIVNAASCILLDIEGTITSIDFVRKKLFIYGEEHIPTYIKEHWNDTEVRKVMHDILHKNNEDKEACEKSKHLMAETLEQLELLQNSLITQLLHQMKINEKTPAIKVLEGLIFKTGFTKGELIGHIYPDVIKALKLWKSQDKAIFIFSNGSVESQRLLLRHSVYGDITEFIDGNFDTSIGSKLDTASYVQICQKSQKEPNEIVFFSDHPLELMAAKQSGLQTFLVVRDPEHPMFIQERDYLSAEVPIINSFLEVME